MKSILTVSLSLILVTAALADDKSDLQGLWQAEKVVGNGKEAPPAVVKKFRIQIEGDTLTFNPGGENRRHTITLDPKAKPKAMDLTPLDGPAKGRTLPVAIYELKGDTLRICLDKEGRSGKRPTRFKTVAGDGLAVLTLKRVKKAR
jgi:uncharacterized protein (TIGR03067 family)